MDEGIANSGAMVPRDGQRVLEEVDREGVLTPRRARGVGLARREGCERDWKECLRKARMSCARKQMREDGSSHPRIRPCSGEANGEGAQGRPTCIGRYTP